MADTDDPVGSIRSSMSEMDGAYSLAMLMNDRLFAVRDPYGFRPLCLGKVCGGYMIASESTAIDALKGEFVRDIEPGEICEVTKDGYKVYPGHEESTTIDHEKQFNPMNAYRDHPWFS